MAETHYRIPEYAPMMAALDSHDLDRYFDLADDLDAHIDAIASDIYDLATATGCIEISIRAPHNRRYYLHTSTRRAELQLTTWDDLGPVGHIDVNDLDDLADELRQAAKSDIWTATAA